MTLVSGSQDALMDIIPFDVPKHPRLPANRFPKGGRAGTLTQVARTAWITGKYLYKYRKKWLAGGLALSVSASTLFQNAQKDIPVRNPNTFPQARYRLGGSTFRSKFKHKCFCPGSRYKKRRL